MQMIQDIRALSGVEEAAPELWLPTKRANLHFCRRGFGKVVAS